MPLMMPSPRALGAALAVSAALLAPSGAGAADFDHSSDRSGYADPYDDPRYADIYGPRAGEQGYRYRYVDRSGGREEPPVERYQEGSDVDDGADDRRYAEEGDDRGVRVDRDEEEVPREGGPRAYSGDDRRYDPPRSYKDDDVRPEPRRYSDAPLPGPRHYREDREPPADFRRGCAPRREIRRALMDDGWFDFSGLQLRGDVALIHARRGNGRVFALKLDRCTGRVLRAEVISPPAHGRWVAGPRRFYPTY